MRGVASDGVHCSAVGGPTRQPRLPGCSLDALYTRLPYCQVVPDGGSYWAGRQARFAARRVLPYTAGESKGTREYREEVTDGAG